ncbi:TPA: Eco57I restriction-modification methylase domain-containing protein [Streptococcus suis]|nr:Eco57I restriction-modification methylase domain-containing protein [Streptococcus suis]
MDKTIQAYYTNSDTITNYMVDRLDLSQSDCILEPSVGEGVFVENILNRIQDVSITTYDIDDYSYNVMNSKFSEFHNVEVIKSDTLLDVDLDLRVSTNQGFSKIIGNPPYGAKYDLNYKKKLNKKYQSIYTKDSYILFFLRCLSLLEESGKLVFIIPDTFLFLNLHQKFREILFNNFVVEEIAIFPSKWFPGISFAYSNLSIITVRNDKEGIPENIIKVYDTLTSDDEFNKIVAGVNVAHKLISQKSILTQSNVNLHLNQEVENIINNSELTLGDLADCVTGIYTGDNKKYLKVRDISVRNSKGYDIVVDSDIFTECANINGTDVPNSYIPLVKGSLKTPYHKPEVDWYIRWDKSAINDYHVFKKARFQNSSYYFKYGIATPMLKSKKVRACLMEDSVFDQSIVGIFPKKTSDLLFILALLNSTIVNEIIHSINPTVNNSANYLKRIPIPKINEIERQQLNKLVLGIVDNHEDNQRELDELFDRLYAKLR